ncbi:MAG: TetR/AcrR family transcriptional regulator, partial [Gemmatimonadaceae bacterium]|nr:TetR/AcrR family transcriptional regulator [Acetobacteraceae bacterium]
ALGMSHANVYRHFASKAALRDAVVERWLQGVSGPLEAIGGADPPARLSAWLWGLIHAKRRKVLDDPGMFATYHVIAQAAHAVVDQHVAELRRQIAAIIRAGIADGSFGPRNPDLAAGAVLMATLPFHHPHFLQDKLVRPSDDEVEAAIRLLLAGLRAGATRPA